MTLRGALFSDEHRKRLEHDGFVRVEEVIPPELVTAVLGALRDVSAVDYADSATWHLLPASYPGIIPSHHHQSQWDIRQHPRLYEVFRELWRTPDLWVSMDRIGFVAPLRPGDTAACEIHWDVDPRGKSVYQAIVYLTDAGPERAPFCAVPDVFRNLDAWLARRPESFDFSCADFSNEASVAVAGKAGDLIIWDSRLPHGPGPNYASSPRVMQAVTLFPASEADWTAEEQISWWRAKRAPPWWRDVPGQQDPEPGEPAVLSEHGRRLVGLRRWDTQFCGVSR